MLVLGKGPAEKRHNLNAKKKKIKLILSTPNFLLILLLSLQGWNTLRLKAKHSTVKKRRGRERAVSG